jgi:hypothetical protein
LSKIVELTVVDNFQADSLCDVLKADFPDVIVDGLTEFVESTGEMNDDLIVHDMDMLDLSEIIQTEPLIDVIESCKIDMCADGSTSDGVLLNRSLNSLTLNEMNVCSGIKVPKHCVVDLKVSPQPEIDSNELDPSVAKCRVSQCYDVWDNELQDDIDRNFILTGLKHGFKIIDTPNTLPRIVRSNY